MSRRLLVVLLAGLMALGAQPFDAQPAGAATRPSVANRAAAHQQVDGIEGDDACGLLSDAEILAATGAASIVSRQPGSQSFMPAGCYWQVESTDMDMYGPWELYLGVQPEGGRTSFDQETSFLDLPRVGGLGDDAAEMFGSYLAVKGDAYVNLQYVAFGGPPRPPELTARALTWLVMQRLPEGGTAVSPTPGPSAAPMTAAQELVGRVRAEPFGDANVDAAIELLARSGIGTWAAPDALAPLVPVEGMESPMRLLREQVRAMAVEAWAGGGILGADLDELVPEDDGLAPASWTLAGYVANGGTEGAEVARALVGAPDWDRPEAVPFPQLALVLFASDLARERLAEAGVASGPRVSRVAHAAVLSDVRTAQGGLCTQASAFLDATLARVFDALRLGEPGGGSIVVRIWDFVVSLAERVARTIVRELTQVVFDHIGKVVAMAAMASAIVSAIRPWAVTVVGVPPVTSKGIGGSPGQPGSLLVRVDLGGLDDWPDIVKDCARVAGHPLPSLKPAGAPVTWAVEQNPPGLIAEGARQGQLDGAGQARLDFVTLVDEVDAPWRRVQGQLAVTAAIERPGLERLRDIALDQLFGQLGQARGAVEPFLRPVIERLTAQAAKLVSSRAFGPATVIYHVPDATPPPDATPEPSTGPTDVWVYVDRPSMTGGTDRVVELVSCSGPYGVWSGVIRLGGVGPVPLAEFPVTFGFRGSAGVQRASTSVQGTMPWDLPGVSYAVRIDLVATVDGTTMRLALTTQLDEQAGGGELFGMSGTQSLDRPIEVAPDGSC